MVKYLFLFDIDGTLLISGGAGKSAIKKAITEVFSIPKPDVTVDFGGRTDLSLAREIFSLNNIPFKKDELNCYFKRYLHHLQNILPKTDGRVLPGVVPLLDELSNRHDVAIGLLTGNIEVGAKAKLNHFRLGHYFSFGGFGDTCEQRNDIAKKAIEAFLSSQLSQQQVKTYVIGDTPHDITCARSINAKAIAVETGFAPPEKLKIHHPDFQLQTLETCLKAINFY